MDGSDRMKRTTPEGALLKAVADLLTLERVWWMRCNTGTQVLADANGKRRVFRAGRKGMADILAIVGREVCEGCQGKHEDIGQCRTHYSHRSRCCGRSALRIFTPVWLELKSATGRQSEAQRAFQTEVEAEGHFYLLVRDVREVAEFLRRA
ncbi:MAG: hypothetical protein KGL39_52020 [Patescibacteria group bacterium]|nr:hypothetical protein [Patescibacteria group bacterium]